MRKLLLVFGTVLILTACNKKEESVELKLDRLLEKNSEISSIEYDSEYRMKYFDYPDTTRQYSQIVFVRDANDTVHGGSIWYHVNDSISEYPRDYVKYYDTQAFYIIDNINKEVTQSSLENPSPYMFEGNSTGDIINTYFLKNKSINRFLVDSTYRTHIEESKDHLQLIINYPDDEDGEVMNKIKHIYLNKDSTYVSKITFRAEIDTLVEYREWYLKNTHFNKARAQDLHNRFLSMTQDYDFKVYQTPKKEKANTSKNPIRINNFKGEFISSQAGTFNLDDYKGKIVILDFWYRTCPPCIKSIPQLNSIYDAYVTDEVLMFGINDIDTKEKYKYLLDLHIKNNDMKYPNVLITGSESDNYDIIGYPTLHILDKSGKVVFTSLGYEENIETKVDSALKSLKQ